MFDRIFVCFANISCFYKSLSINIFYSQGNGEDGNQSPGEEGQKSQLSQLLELLREDVNEGTADDAVQDSDANQGPEWQESDGKGDQRGEGEDNTWQCDNCHNRCKVASHLRQSKECLTHLKSKPQFQFKGSAEDEVFIVKFSLIKGDSP